MIADLIDDKLKLRFITRNVMSVYSTRVEYIDAFIRKLKHSEYIIDKKATSSDSFISYNKKDYNIYKNIFRYVKKHNHINTDKFIEYLNYFNLSHLLWLHFYQLGYDDSLLVDTLMQLSSDKQVIITDYIDDIKYKDKLYSLLFHVGLENKLIIVPFKNIRDAVNNSTCQCYIKHPHAVKIQSEFSNNFINTEFNTSVEYYNGTRPFVYKHSDFIASPISYKYTFIELMSIWLFSIKMLYISLFNRNSLGMLT
jgi:hypothetical protein